MGSKRMSQGDENGGRCDDDSGSSDENRMTEVLEQGQ